MESMSVAEVGLFDPRAAMACAFQSFVVHSLEHCTATGDPCACSIDLKEQASIVYQTTEWNIDYRERA